MLLAHPLVRDSRERRAIHSRVEQIVPLHVRIPTRRIVGEAPDVFRGVPATHAPQRLVFVAPLAESRLRQPHDQPFCFPQLDDASSGLDVKRHGAGYVAVSWRRFVHMRRKSGTWRHV